MTRTHRWTYRPEGSNWGDFGPDDQIGRLNFLGSEAVMRGISEVREGRSFCLSLPLDLPGGSALNPRRSPPRHFATARNGQSNFNHALARHDPDLTDVICDDAVLLHTQYSTQWDSLAHVGGLFDADGDGVAEPVYYNGWRAGEHITGSDGGEPCCGCGDIEGVAARRLGIETMAETGLQSRGVLVDLHAAAGEKRIAIGRDALLRAMDAQGVAVERGDILCLHTGFADAVIAMRGQPDAVRLHTSFAVLDGHDPALLNWLTDSGIAALAADNYAVEQSPAESGKGLRASLPLHEHCLFKIGLPLGELWHLGPLNRHLRAQGRSSFLLTAPPLRLPGAVGSPVTPVATV
ncbi:cyclase family protein [Celeribacter sp.]|uniref:cyclase family protein n=1 Tax=Celeribacter sp. TaxID=1890673 RepID=UPI003A8CD5C2